MKKISPLHAVAFVETARYQKAKLEKEENESIKVLTDKAEVDYRYGKKNNAQTSEQDDDISLNAVADERDYRNRRLKEEASGGFRRLIEEQKNAYKQRQNQDNSR